MSEKKGFLSRSDLITLVLSLITGLMIWTYVDSRRTEERQMRVRLDVGLPEGWEMIGENQQKIQVTLRGPRQIMGALRSDELHFFRAVEDLPRGQQTQDVQLALTQDDLRGLPRDLTVVDIPDPTIHLKLVRPVRRYLPVKVALQGTPSDGYYIHKTSFSPKYVPVYAPSAEFEGVFSVSTRSVDVNGRNSTFGQYVDLAPLKMHDRTLYLPDPVFVQVDIEAKPQRQVLQKVPVSILLATPMEKLSGGKIIPSQVSVTVEGSADALKALAAGAVTVYIDTKEMGSSVQGEYVLRCRFLAPQTVKVVAVNPPEVRWVIPKQPKPEAAPAAGSAAQEKGVKPVTVKDFSKAAPAKTEKATND